MPANIGEFVDRSCRRFSDRAVAIDGARRITYGDLARRMNQVANRLLASGLRPGERIALLVGNRLEWFELTYGLAKGGFVRTYLHPRAVAAELNYQLVDSGATVLFVAPEYVDLGTP